MNKYSQSVLAMLLIGFCIVSSADEKKINVSKAWFKPELLVNNNPEVCAPIFKSFFDHFSSYSKESPLKPISSREWDKNRPDLPDKLRELEWKEIGQSEGNLNLTEWKEGTTYFGIVEATRSIGWREPYYEYFLIDKPLSDADIVDEKTPKSYEEKALAYFRKTDRSDVLDLIYKSDPRFSNFQENLSGRLSNIYAVNNRVYIAFNAMGSDNEPQNHFIISLMGPRQARLVCKFTTFPSSQTISEQARKIAHYNEFEGVIFNMMGGAGSCGTLNAHGRASYQLREALNTLIYRPWTHASVDRLTFLAWGHSGIWNYKKYLEFNDLMPKAKQGLADYYIKNYQLEPGQAMSLANMGVNGALDLGFNHGRTEDASYLLHRALLEGRPDQEISSLLAEYEGLFDKSEESLLSYAVDHPNLTELLLKRGLDPNKANNFGKTPLMYAAQFNALEAARLLIKYGANTELATTQPFDSCNYTLSTHHVTALHYAVRYASREFIELLVEKGAITSANDSHGHTPLDYLIRFGGHIGYRNPTTASYGEQNKLLAKSNLDSLKTLLTPPSEEQRRLLADKYNLNAESLYRSGKIKEAYAMLKKALSLQPNNERAMANLSLVALRVELYGESAKAATYLIKNGRSDKERASAYFNLALACRGEEKSTYHYSSISYDGQHYCQERGNQYQGPLFFLLKAYQTYPTKQRENAIVSFFDATNDGRGKWLCRAADSHVSTKAVYVTMNHVYFLAKTGSDISYSRIARRERDKEDALEVKQKESIPLDNGLSIFRWDVYVPFQGTLVLGDQLCSRSIPLLIDDGTELVELYSSQGDIKSATVTSATTKPIVLLLYGNHMQWTITDESKNIRAIHVHGKDSNVQYAGKKRFIVSLDTKQYAYSEPAKSSYNLYTPLTIGLKISAMIDLKTRSEINVTDNDLSLTPR